MSSCEIKYAWTELFATAAAAAAQQQQQLSKYKRQLIPFCTSESAIKTKIICVCERQ
jgi:hypothetical protein